MVSQKKIGITDTILRDAHQSLMATRMTIEDMLPILTKLDQVGYDALECWGGATFDACIRFLDENPWERLRTFKKHMPNTPLMMLLRGQNLLGYRHYADDVVERFVELAAENGIDIFRIFDALNDFRNLEASLNAVKKSGKHAQIAIAYTTSEVHTVGYYVNLAKEIKNLGADSICIKDMAGILTPKVADVLVRDIKKEVSLPVNIHSHCTSGNAQMTYLKAIEAGADWVDTAISPFSEGTSQPATESLALTLSEMGYEIDVDVELVHEIAQHFKAIRTKYLDEGVLSPEALSPDPRALTFQVPGGMLSNMASQLEEANAMDRYEEVLEEIPKVRADLGFPPLVTPMSQMVGTQATLNVLMEERYEMVATEVKQYLTGEYGKTPVAVNEEFREGLIGDVEVITERPANLLENELADIRKEAAAFAKNDEEVLIYALFPEVGKAFLEKRAYQREDTGVDGEPIRIFGQLH